MTAPVRPTAADLWRRAAEISQEWLEIGLSTEPADRRTAEDAITTVYAGHGRPRPEFRWVLSPRAAIPHLAGMPTHADLRSWIAARRPSGSPPAASDIAAGLSRLRSTLAAGYDELPPVRPVPKRAKGAAWAVLSPAEGLAAGLPFLEILRQGVFGALFRSLAEGVYLPTRAALGPVPPPVGWYGNQDAAWIAFFDVQRRLGLAPGHASLDRWVTLARSAGWWWPGEDRCVMVERPAVLRPSSTAPHIEYRDGWSVG